MQHGSPDVFSVARAVKGESITLIKINKDMAQMR